MWSLCGSSVAVLIAFIFPATCYLRLFAVDAAGAEAPGAAAGGGGHGGGPCFATGDMIQARQWSGYGSGARWSSSSRCAARALLGAAYVVMVVCTTQNVRRALAR